MTRAALVLFTVCLAAVAGRGEEKEAPQRMKSATFQGLKLRAIGPALMSGRIADVAIDPIEPNTWYVAAGSGNLWKTVNAGTTFTPIFEDYPSYSIGCVTVDPHNHHTVWVGTGEAVGGRHVGFGDGVYLSLDAGKSFTNMGLKKSEHIAKILIDPRDSKRVYVAAQGPLWAPGGERGLYRSSDAGKSWQLILAKGPYTGVTDIAFDPRNPDIIFAVAHQRQRTVAALVNGGPETGIHKSIDGGKTWRELKKGLPTGDVGKIGIAVSPQKPDVIYATIELPGRKGGFWRSADAGETWSKQSDYISGGTGPHYYQELWADPHRFDVLYQANVQLGRSEDGGKTWQSVDNRNKHVDNHAIGFHPTDRDFLLVGCDGGLYISHDYAKTYRYCANLPLTQFYKVSVDNDVPFYNIVGGTQDNSTQYGPGRTKSEAIRNRDWKAIIGGDGHDCAIDPVDPNIIYCESQKGYLRRYDRRTGESIDIRPQPARGEESLRFNWDSPVYISPHAHTRVYFGSKKLHRSDDRGDSWTTISPDLSRNLDRFKLPLMERVQSIDAVWDLYAMSAFGNITSITESPLVEGLIYVGTDDGLIQVTENGGKTWRKIDKIFGVPEFAFVNDIKADLHDANTVYACCDHHKTGDFKPYVLKSTDRGKTWSSIAGDLPGRHLCWRIVQDHVKKDLFFLGTEFGLFFTVNGGKNWIKLSGNVPTIPFRDLEIQKRENDLIGATFGRSFYVLDDYSPLRDVSEEALARDFTLFPVRKTLLYVQARELGGRKGSQGDAYFAAPNPPIGAVFTYHLRDTLKTRKQLRQEQEGKVKSDNGDTPYPGFDPLKKEEREEEPAITFTITDETGNFVQRITGPTSAGFHRVDWNLRYAPFTAEGGQGPLVAPGVYKVNAEQRLDDKTSPLGLPQRFEVIPLPVKPGLEPQDRTETLAFQQKAGALQRAVIGANGKLGETLEQLDKIKAAVRRAGAGNLYDEARRLELQLLDIKDGLTGDRTRESRSQEAPLPVIERAQIALVGALNSTYGPTKTQRREYEIAREDHELLAKRLNTILEVDFVKLKESLDKAQIPWTPGRKIPELKE
ncbi:MAG: glycosyl hydrolase [Gemmataceae bacterium]